MLKNKESLEINESGQKRQLKINSFFALKKNVHNKMKILKNEMGRNSLQKGSKGKINGKLEDA